MTEERLVPNDPLAFIRECVGKRSILWTHHVNMRLRKRGITREMVVEAIWSYEIIESYPDDKYLPSFLVRADHPHGVMHVLFATDVLGENVRVVTAYHPDSAEWSEDFRRRQL